MSKEHLTLGETAYRAIDKHFHKILEHEAGVLEDKDPEDLHQMRVGTRRLRGVLSGFAVAVIMPKNTNLKSVAKIARVLGELRDIDVLQEELTEENYPLPSGEIKYLQEIRDSLDGKRVIYREKVVKILGSSLYEKFKIAFQEWLQEPRYYPVGDKKIIHLIPDLILPQLCNFFLHRGWFIDSENNIDIQEVEKTLHAEAEIIHDLRKEAKKIRYNLELFEDFYKGEYGKHLHNIKKIQSILGEIQDSQILGEYLENNLEVSLAEQLPSLLEKLQKKRLSKWQEWQKSREIYLNQRHRQELYTAILHPN